MLPAGAVGCFSRTGDVLMDRHRCLNCGRRSPSPKHMDECDAAFFGRRKIREVIPKAQTEARRILEAKRDLKEADPWTFP